MPAFEPLLGRIVRDLRRRKVFRVALAYLAVGWLLIEVTDTIAPALVLPGWTLTLVTVLVLLGLPVALVLAWAYDVSPGGIRRTPAGPDVAGDSRLSRAGAIAGVSGVTVLGLAAGAFLWVGGEEPSAALDPDLIAVLPFRVSGGPELDYLQEGMVDALAVTWTGVAGPRAVDPASVFARLKDRGANALTRDSAGMVAGELGAAEALVGSVVGGTARLTLHASRISARDGRSIASTRVVGPLDSLPWLVDRLTAELLSLGAGQGTERLPSLADHPLEAVRAYLEGQAAFRNSRFVLANERLRDALEIDSTFALAAVHYRRALGWNRHANTSAELTRALDLAWRNRDQLGPVDMAMLRAEAGPRYPHPSSIAERLREWEKVVEYAPDRADAWFAYADLLFHAGEATGRLDAFEVGRRGFERALAVDSSFVLALTHLIDASMWLSDPRAVERFGGIWLERDSSSYVRKYVAVARDYAAGHDNTFAGLVREGTVPDDMEFFTSWALFGWETVTSNEPVYRAELERWLARSASVSEQHQLLEQIRVGAYNRGRPGAADSAAARLSRIASNPHLVPYQQLYAALYWGAPEETGARAAKALAEAAEAAISGDPEDAEALYVLCAMGQWRLATGDSAFARRAADVLDGHGSDRDGSAYAAAICGLALRSWLEPGSLITGPSVDLVRLDSLLATGPPVSVSYRASANLLVARLAEQVGRTDMAFRASRRMYYGPGMQYYLATAYREQGRLAVAAGDTAFAVDRLRRYLGLRHDPEPALAGEVESVRRLLASLGAEGG